ncbi:error-prone DNA polymerase [Leucobacter sp. OLJS4]|uniref:PHP domain-containing protein n=1 Tax=unclassified Leucobacter TaxID=2621730 RepID=UPI000C198321|nr:MULTISPECIES: PHP domain-containing protein [unclassified Leucobacter]PII81736.1 error-prone DNA polymerase [Leucobacter sp. OLCALW19]PII86410.1 error-prone DNA polymerase [Leucobacter sp. OLTLW20]PII90305.1 error-prone DNA polymerase [Leucobacter sp. OLAS13]PII97338.1 error-prone DNA polymerase [Leucobacter sp. OLDS2]PIJ00895.1 error-prone DNA polymerase [Leucobacter sp. OLCS4]
MKWDNSRREWSELERILSARPPAHARGHDAMLTPLQRPEPADGSDPPRTAPNERTGDAGAPQAMPQASVPYAELHAHSHYSFLDGASSPEALIAEATRLGLTGIAITDHDGFYGAARFAEAARFAAAPLDTVYGAELTIGLDAPQLGIADPGGTHLLVLANGVDGYHRLAGAITEAQLAGGEKGRPRYDLDALAETANGEWTILTGCRKGAVRQAMESASTREAGDTAAARALDDLIARFGRDHVLVELTDHGLPGDDVRVDRLAALASATGVATVATGAVHYARSDHAQLADAMAAIRARRSLDEIDAYLPATGAARIRSGASMLRRFAGHTDAVTRTASIARQIGFPLRTARPKLPKLDVPEGHTQISWLRELAWRGAAERYRLPDPEVEDRLERELAVIERLDFPGYFLIVHDIVQFAKGRGILCQGRGSAANSAICFVLGITAVDSVLYNLPFERFLSSMREEEPDIDVDFDSERREEVIQYVYERYGRRNAAQVANVISYRPKSAARDAAKALGYTPGKQDLEALPPDVAGLAEQLRKTPRHLGIHSGGMVLTEQPVGEVCPIEHARMPGRTVLQWDKDDCAAMGLVKFDLLGLGMLGAIRISMDLVAEALGERWTLETIPKEEAGVYDMLCRGDAIGVFQLESRAQINTLPRLLPRRFYDLVIEIALIRPGPLQGGAVHPYLRRRAGTEEADYPHPKLKPVLERTLGVPLFQEQLMQMAMAIGDCDAEDADLLRRSMGSKRGTEQMNTLKDKLLAGMKRNGLGPEESTRIYEQIEAFANFGFAESHSISFALLVYVSAWLKLHYPAAFLVGLLRAQPMGFYAPRTLVEDARRHGVQVRPADVQRSEAHASLEPQGTGQKEAPSKNAHPQNAHPQDTQPDPTHRAAPSGPDSPISPGNPDSTSGISPSGPASCASADQPPVPPFVRGAADDSGRHRRDRPFAVRLGLSGIQGIETAVAERIAAARAAGPFLDLADLARRADLDRRQLEALASAGACAGLGVDRREALWSAGPAADNRDRYLPGVAVHVQPPLLPLLTPEEQTALDLWTTGVIGESQHPLALLRDRLDRRGVIRSDRVKQLPPGRFVAVAGIVTHRQQPPTGGGVVFLTLEDESGTVNIITWADVWQRFRTVARASPALIVSGPLERSPEGVVNVVAAEFEPLPAPQAVSSRDFR